MTTWERKKARMKAREDIAERIRWNAGCTPKLKRSRVRIKSGREQLYDKLYAGGMRGEELKRSLDEMLVVPA